MIVLEGVVKKWPDEHGGNQEVLGLGRGVHCAFEVRVKPDALDDEEVFEPLEFAGERFEGGGPGEAESEVFGEPFGNACNGVWLMAAGEYCGEGVEEKMGLELRFQSLKFAGSHGGFGLRRPKFRYLNLAALEEAHEAKAPDREHVHPVIDREVGLDQTAIREHFFGADNPQEEEPVYGQFEQGGQEDGASCRSQRFQ